jgi:hypothetical protein
MTDVAGRTVKRIDPEKNRSASWIIPVYISDLQAGIYFIAITGKPYFITQKLIITR